MFEWIVNIREIDNQSAIVVEMKDKSTTLFKVLQLATCDYFAPKV